jgi:hypothetical protein
MCKIQLPFGKRFGRPRVGNLGFETVELAHIFSYLPPILAGDLVSTVEFGRERGRKTATLPKNAGGGGMKRYVIFAVLVPLLGGFLVLIATTVTSGYWTHTNWSEVAKLFTVFGKTLQYSYLFGILPALMLGAVDDILWHVKRIGWVVRMLMVGVLAFVAAELLYGSRGADSGALQFILYGMVGFVPATISSWLAHRMMEQQPAAA